MFERFDQEPACAGGGIKDGFAEPWINHLNHKPNDGSGCVELAGVASRVAHLTQHRFIKRAKRVQLASRREMDVGDSVDYISQEITALHPVIDAPKDGSDHVAAIVAV